MPTTVASYFRNIYDNVRSISIGMKITLKYCFQKTVTVQYPEQRLSFVLTCHCLVDYRNLLDASPMLNPAVNS